MATVSTKLTLDTSGFNRGIKSAESGMAKFKAAAGPAVLGAIAAGFAAAAAAAAGLAVGSRARLTLEARSQTSPRAQAWPLANFASCKKPLPATDYPPSKSGQQSTKCNEPLWKVAKVWPLTSAPLIP
jgi:hypothetical protein